MTDESASRLYNWDDFEVPTHTPFSDMQRRRIDKENNPNVANQNVCPEGVVKEIRKLNLNTDNVVPVALLPVANPVQQSLEPSNVPTSPEKTYRKPLTRSQVKLAAPPPQSKGAIKKTTAVQPLQNNVAQYATIYKAKKDRKMKQLEAEEKRMRQFHSKPAPNFSARHRKLDQLLEQNKKLPSCPVTPRTLKTSQAISEAQKLKIEEYQKPIRPVFVANTAEVVHQRPYKPKLDHRRLETEPFNLRMSERLLERKEYDQQYERSCEEKRLQEQIIKEMEEKVFVKQLRRQAEFKANRNPFA